MIKLRKLVALATISAMLPTAALSAPSSDVQSALKATNVGDSGFLDLFVGCQFLSWQIIKGSGRDFDSEKIKYMFVHDSQAHRWGPAMKNYLANIANVSLDWNVLLRRPLAIDIAKHFNKQFDTFDSNSDFESFSTRLTGPCIIAGTAILKSLTATPQKQKSPEIVSQRNSSKDKHNQCLDARDYEGCMRVKSSGVSNSTAGDKCNKKGACKVTTQGNDSFGLPKPMGWMYVAYEGDKLLYWSKTHRVPHNGEQTRYVGMKTITRYYRNPEDGTSGTFIRGGTAFTNCSGYNNSLSCSTSGGSSTYIPGKSASPGGVRSALLHRVYDCKDNTYAVYDGNRKTDGWTKNASNGYAKVLKESCRINSSEIMQLDTMKVHM